MKHLIIILNLILLLTGCAAKKDIAWPVENDMILTNKKVLMVIPPKDFRDVEYIEPRQAIENSGAEVKVASIQGGIAIGAEGAEARIDLTVSEVEVENFDAVVFVGGSGMAQIINDESLQVLAKKFYNAGKSTAAICVAPAILAKAGILSGKKATAWPGVKADLERAGAVYTGDSVTVDDKIITGSGPAAAKEFGGKIVENLWPKEQKSPAPN